MLAELAIAIFVLTRTAATDGESAKEFRDMSTLYRLLKDKVTEPKLPTGTGASQTYETPQTLMTAILERAVKLNLTIAGNDIAQALSSDKPGLDGNKLTSDPETKNIFSGITPEIAAVMLQKYRTTARGKQPDKPFVAKFNLPVPENQRSQLQPVIANLASGVLTTANELTETANRITKLRKDARTAMIKALYGNAYGTKLEAQITGDSEVPPPAPAEFPWDVSKTRDNNCKEATDTPGDAGNINSNGNNMPISKRPYHRAHCLLHTFGHRNNKLRSQPRTGNNAAVLVAARKQMRCSYTEGERKTNSPYTKPSVVESHQCDGDQLGQPSSANRRHRKRRGQNGDPGILRGCREHEGRMRNKRQRIVHRRRKRCLY
uniref:Variant surface glycoprotein 1125.4892 n=1 Tax=Trypanosoma brucei TaxID=5691 RepID=A0A1J0RB61_9TRYP|nr:variant surface glycoprotein 1125.4892 [Trypanosoma brucei]